MFSHLGMNMLPMPLVHPWNLFALLLLLGVASPLFALLDRRATGRHAIIFLLTMQGVGALSYYQGRSHNWTLIGVTVYAFMLMAFFADSLLSVAREARWHLLPCALLIYLLGASVFQVAYQGKAIAGLITDTENRIRYRDEQRLVENNAAFIRSHTEEGEKVLIFTHVSHQALCYGLSRTRAAINPGQMDLFWRSDYDRLLEFLGTNLKTKIFFDTQGYQSQPEVTGLLYRLYTPRATNGALFLLERKGLP
jgi:hypothetical protein